MSSPEPKVFDSLPDTDAECPFHDLDPAETVFVDIGRMVLPYSAEHACLLFHESLTIRRVQEAIAAALIDGPAVDAPAPLA